MILASRRSLVPCFVLVAGLGASTAEAAPAYVRSNVGAPWGSTSNEEAMDLAFGPAAWDDLRFETVDPLLLFSDGYHFVYLEGSDSNASELEAFLGANQDLVETWVGSGGTLFLNAAPNEGGSQNWGFGGITLNYSDSAGTGTATDPQHPIWQGPFVPCATDFTGSSYAHASVSGPGLNPMITNVDNPMGNPNLAEMPFGSGTVVFGGLTTSNFWEPQPDALHLRANIINYLASGAMQGPCHNGMLEDGEECDDGNFINTDDCVGACVLPTCGDGYVQAGVEPCDDGDDDDTDACLVGCIAAACGDGIVEAGVEACDDDDDDNTDVCIDTCELASCGDGHVFAGFEECDDANATPGDGCTACQLDSAESSSEGGGESSSEGGMDSSGGAEGAETTAATGADTGVVDTTDGESTGSVDTTGGGSATSSDPTNATSATASGSGGSEESTGTGATDPTGSGCGCDAGAGGDRMPWLLGVLLGVGVGRRRRGRAHAGARPQPAPRS